MKATTVIADDIFWQIPLYFVVHTTGNKHLGGLEEGGGSAAFRSDFSPWLLTAHRLFSLYSFFERVGPCKAFIADGHHGCKKRKVLPKRRANATERRQLQVICLKSDRV